MNTRLNIVFGILGPVSAVSAAAAGRWSLASSAEEELLLAAEVVIDGPLAAPDRLGHEIHVRAMIPRRAKTFATDARMSSRPRPRGRPRPFRPRRLDASALTGMFSSLPQTKPEDLSGTREC